MSGLVGFRIQGFGRATLSLQCYEPPSSSERRFFWFFTSTKEPSRDQRYLLPDSPTEGLGCRDWGLGASARLQGVGSEAANVRPIRTSTFHTRSNAAAGRFAASVKKLKSISAGEP